MYYYQHHIGDYRRDTAHLSLLEHGIYRQLLDLYYISEKPLDANALRLICARSADEIRAAKQILSEFFTLEDGIYYHDRCEDEINKFHKKSDMAKASAKARWNKNNNLEDANALPTQSEGNANHKPITNNHKPVKYIPPIPSDLLVDYLKVRKAKKAGELTERSFKAIEREAKLSGISVEQAIIICCERSWITYKNEWINKPQCKSFKEDTMAAARSIFTNSSGIPYYQAKEIEVKNDE